MNPREIFKNHLKHQKPSQTEKNPKRFNINFPQCIDTCKYATFVTQKNTFYLIQKSKALYDTFCIFYDFPPLCVLHAKLS